ncbi:MAG: RNA 2',3'-cyclic phosphodiesterase [Phycisphaeraceae bacterium]|nr:RNA 2',3'-cyclic phosphodiesterase [Phycisphaeraceae bacterium]
MSRTLRLFVAAYPPLPIVEAWLASARSLLPTDVRLSTPEQVHLTLVFLGDREERDLPEIRESIRAATAGIGEAQVEARQLQMLPERGPPRLLAAVTSLPSSLAELQRRLARRLALRSSKRDEFLPHFTLARFPGKSINRRAERLAPEKFVISEIRLVRSRLLSAGAEHESDKAFPLQPV